MWHLEAGRYIREPRDFPRWITERKIAITTLTNIVVQFVVPYNYDLHIMSIYIKTLAGAAQTVSACECYLTNAVGATNFYLFRQEPGTLLYQTDRLPMELIIPASYTLNFQGIFSGAVNNNTVEAVIHAQHVPRMEFLNS